MSDREERIEKAAEAIADACDDGCFEHLRSVERMEASGEYDPAFIRDEREGAAEDADYFRKLARAAAPFLESSPAPDEVAVAAKRLVDTIDGMQKGAEKMGGQWYFPDLVLEDRDALRAALNEQDRASLPKGKEDRK